MKQIVVLLAGLIGLGICLYSLTPAFQTADNRDILPGEVRSDFACQAAVEHATLKLGETQTIIILARAHNGQALKGLSGLVIMEYPSGYKQNTYLPPTGEDGLSTIEFPILEEYFGGEVGRVIVQVVIEEQNMVCQTQTTFLMWY